MGTINRLLVSSSQRLNRGGAVMLLLAVSFLCSALEATPLVSQQNKRQDLINSGAQNQIALLNQQRHLRQQYSEFAHGQNPRGLYRRSDSPSQVCFASVL